MEILLSTSCADYFKVNLGYKMKKKKNNHTIVSSLWILQTLAYKSFSESLCEKNLYFGFSFFFLLLLFLVILSTGFVVLLTVRDFNLVRCTLYNTVIIPASPSSLLPCNWVSWTHHIHVLKKTYAVYLSEFKGGECKRRWNVYRIVFIFIICLCVVLVLFLRVYGKFHIDVFLWRTFQMAEHN